MTDISVHLVDHMGSSLSVVNAARVSFDKQKTQFGDDDDKLLRYLAKNGHWSPFAHAFLSFRIKAPIFVARQLVKHQVGLSWNEVSRRYVKSEPEFYMPDEWRAAPTDGAKQGSSDGSHLPQLTIDRFVREAVDQALATYSVMLKDGVAPEMARMVLPQNMMTEWIWSGSLYAFARVCKERLHPHAQPETAMVAEEIDAFAEHYFARAWNALKEQRDA